MKFFINRLAFLLILLIGSLILPIFSPVFAQEKTITPSEILEKVKKIGERILEVIQKGLSIISEKIWKKQVLPLWQEKTNWVKKWWNEAFLPKIKGFFKEKVELQIKKGIEKIKTRPIIEEFKKEVEELKEELSRVSKSFWERAKKLIK